MQVKIEKVFQVKEPIDRVWKLLSDPRKVATCVPGAQITEALDERTYKGSISVKVGPVVTDYKGEVRIERLDEQNYEMELIGNAQDIRGRGGASMKMAGQLRALDDGSTTEVTSVSEVSIVGLLAQLGSRMIGEVSNKMFEEFTENFQRQFQQRSEGMGAEAETAPEPRPIKAIPLVLSVTWAAIVRFFRRIFGGAAQS